MTARDGLTQQHARRVQRCAQALAREAGINDSLIYDALTSDRPYRRALSHGSAVAMIHERRGTMYDTEIADAFLRIVQHLRLASPREGAEGPQTRANTPWLEARAV